MSQPAPYRRYRCALARTQRGDLICCIGPSQDSVQRHWDSLKASTMYPGIYGSPDDDCSVPSSVSSSDTPPSSPSLSAPSLPDSSPSSSPLLSLASLSLLPSSPSSVPPLLPLPGVTKSSLRCAEIHPGQLDLYETRQAGGDVVVGIIFEQPPETMSSFDIAFASLLMKNIKLFTSPPQDLLAATALAVNGTTEAIVDLFDVHLRYVSRCDKWESHGRAYFSRRVHEFVRRGEKVAFCLPAFPCKSSNPDKVGGPMPDRGEQLALEHLHSFVESLERIYAPGAKLWIISDGHVFSDCIGVDDEVVDAYNAQLVEMNECIGQRRGSTDRIGFKSLVDLFSLEDLPAAWKHALQLPKLPSFMPTRRTEAAELSREILVRGCGADEGVLRARIASGAAATLKLYRGFSRFLLEDLGRSRHTRHLSRSRQRKASSKIALEMMQRNEAYSNLVEVLFPGYVRLSIHAHDNAGPKFGIRLFGPDVRASLLDHNALLLAASGGGGGGVSAEMCSVDYLHVPTPWHNCIVEVEGRSNLIMTKAKAVRDALDSGKFRGGWVCGTAGGIASRFCLRDVESKSVNDDDDGDDAVVEGTLPQPSVEKATHHDWPASFDSSCSATVSDSDVVSSPCLHEKSLRSFI